MTDDNSDWVSLRDRCITHLATLIKHAETLALNSKDHWAAYQAEVATLPAISWKEIKKHSCPRERDIAVRVTAALFELPDIIGLHGEFQGTMQAAKQWVALLDGCNDVDAIYLKFCEIDDSF